MSHPLGEPDARGSADPEVIQDLRNQLVEQEELINDLKDQLEAARKAGDAGEAEDALEEARVAYELEMEQKDARIAALENEQVNAADRFAAELGDLRNQLMRAKMSGSE